MNQELQDKLFKTYPSLFTDKLIDGGLVCEDGWYKLIDTLCYMINNYCNHCEMPYIVPIQIKEKFGGLRFYYSGGDKYIRGLVDFAETISYNICDQCGKQCESKKIQNYTCGHCEM